VCYCCCSRACVPAIILLHSLRYLSSPGTAYITGREAARARNIPAENHPVRNIAHQSGYNHRNDATVTVHQSQPHFCKYIFCTFAFTQHGAIWGSSSLQPMVMGYHNLCTLNSQGTRIWNTSSQFELWGIL